MGFWWCFALCTGVTTMLNFFTTSNGFRSTLPVVSNLTAMNVWDGVCMCFIYASLLEFVCVNYVGRKRPLHNVVYRPGENPVTQVNTPLCLSQFHCIERHQCYCLSDFESNVPFMTVYWYLRVFLYCSRLFFNISMAWYRCGFSSFCIFFFGTKSKIWLL